jgi:tRNA pseudouridine55 synthase
MDGIIHMWKKIGETPLQTLARARETYSIDADIKACYTGRLDPIAQGIIVILFGDMIHRSPEFNSSDKTYQFQAILGVSTDSYDAMGRLNHVYDISYSQAKQYLHRIVELHGDVLQPMPPCSAYKYKGKPLWMHYRAGTLPEKMPTKKVHVYDVTELCPNPLHITLASYRKECLDDIGDVHIDTERDGSFPLDDIKKDWRACDGKINLYRVLLRAHVSSGTYIRSLVHDTGKSLNIPAHAFRITRIGIGIGSPVQQPDYPDTFTFTFTKLHRLNRII